MILIDGPYAGMRGVLVKHGDPIAGVVVASDVFLFDGRRWGHPVNGWCHEWVRTAWLVPYSGPLSLEEVRWVEAKQGGW